MNLKNEVNTSLCEVSNNDISISDYSGLCSFSQLNDKSKLEEVIKNSSISIEKNNQIKAPPSAFQIHFTFIISAKVFQLIKKQFLILFKIVYPTDFFQKVYEKKYYSIVGLNRLSGEIMCFSHIDVKKLSKTAYILAFGVVKEFQNKKIGGRLLTKIIEELTVLGIEDVSLMVQANNEYAIRLYKNFGFIIEEVKEDYYTFDDINENKAYVMSKKLSMKSKMLYESFIKMKPEASFL